MPESRVLVVGTTNDYIRMLDDRFGDHLVFVTDIQEHQRRLEFYLHDSNEVVCDLSDHDGVLSALKSHLDRHALKVSGVVCFDCESMPLAACLAPTFGVSYPSSETIAICRNKYVSKNFWRKSGILCPEFVLIRNSEDAVEFQKRIGGPIVIKPLTGSGSEFVSLCEDELDCRRACRHLQMGILSSINQRLYSADNIPGKDFDPRMDYLAEEYIGGVEYSCDFVIDGDRLDIIRIARKFPAPNMVLGTTMAYYLPASLPAGLTAEELQHQLIHASHAVGLKRAIGMVDFRVHHNLTYLLELTPRPGGDCLPELIKAGSGFDILGAAIDFSEGKKITFPPVDRWIPLVGLRLPAPAEGIIENIGDCKIRKDPRVLSSTLKRQPGENIILPPGNYGLWNLGTVIFKPTGEHQIEIECREIIDKLRLDMVEPSCTTVPVH